MKRPDLPRYLFAQAGQGPALGLDQAIYIGVGQRFLNHRSPDGQDIPAIVPQHPPQGNKIELVVFSRIQAPDVDGTDLLTHCLPAHTYVAGATPEQRKGLLERLGQLKASLAELSRRRAEQYEAVADHVVDTTDPVITLLGSDPVTAECSKI